MKCDTVTFDGKKMDYCMVGHGPKTLVVVPGISFHKVTSQPALIEAANQIFADDYTVYVFDRKDDMEEGYSIDGMAEDTILAMKALGLGKACFIGSSQGGMIVQTIAINHPEMTEKIMLNSTSARISETTRNVVNLWISWSKNREMLTRVDDMVEMLYTKEFIERADPAGQLRKVGVAEENYRRFIIMCEAALPFDVYDRLGEIKCPVCVTGPDVDVVITEAATLEMAKKLCVPVHKFVGYKHSCFDECSEMQAVCAEFFL